jgi:hypothetical protein
MRYALLLIATVLSAVAASAEEYKKGPNGGLMLATLPASMPNS